MLLTSAVWLYITLICYLAGHALIALVRRFISVDVYPLPWPLFCLLGAAILTNALGYLYLWLPINAVVHVLVAAILVGYAIWKKPFSAWRPTSDTARKAPKNALTRWIWPTVLGLAFLTVLIRSAQLPRLNDTGGYHAPMIEWIRHYAIVPGLANLNYRFGFNNSWFLLNAFFALPLPGAPVTNALANTVSPWHGINGWLLLMGLAYAVTIWQKKPLAWLWAGFMAGLLLVFHWTLASPTPDLPAQLYAGMVLFIWLDNNGFRAKPLGIEAWLCLLFGLAAMTTKLSTVTVLLLPALTLLQALRQRNWPFLTVATITIVLATAYWWAGNMILTGYLVYPTLSPLVDLFSVDWKVPRYLIEQGLFNLTDGTKAGYAGPAWRVGAWVPHWFITRPPLEQVTAVLLAGVPVAAFFGQKRTAHTGKYGQLWALITATVGVTFWFLLAPDLRFGAASVLLLLLLVYGPVAQRLMATLTSSQRQSTFSLLGILLTTSLLTASFKREVISWLLPAPYPNPPLTTVSLGSQTLYLATDRTDVAHGIRGYWSNCYAAPLPCAPYRPPGLQLRGESLGQGFRIN
ncbi:hypothetical protein J2I47_11985 [Fibrella sp. HMF5335]|uniref:DUF8201 domain-containing protein n=1 Tax=Fibrella rubiginis TaxID=2817060 RepID=A0A939K1L4_9BACT|nr:hypothetical protein [Fibrella rubiginis]MBO0937267.1 hypothetical protein [Fibrella rubiginis]